MSNTNEQLGITLSITKASDFDRILGDLEKWLNSLGDSLNKAFQGGGSGGALKNQEQDAARMTQRVQALMQAWTLSAKEVKEYQKAMSDMSAFTRFAQGMKQVKDSTDQATLAEKAMLAVQQKNTDAANKKAEAMMKAARASQAAQGSSIMGAYSNSGIQPVNGGWVMSSVNTRQSLDQAHASALRMNEALGQTQRQTNLLNISFSNMATRIAEFYAIRKVLFLVTGEFQRAFQTMKDFNQAIHDTAAISNASREELLKMSDAALQIARSSKFSSVEVMESMKMLAQAGVAAKDIPMVARAVDMFATGTGATPHQASEVVTTAMNVWEVKAEDTGKVTNLLTGALNASKLEVGQLSTAFNYLANQSALSGKSMEETTSVIAVMANQGMKASTIGTSVSSLLNRLAAPTPKFQALLDKYKISLDEVSPRVNSFAEIVGRFEKAAVPAEHIMAALEQRTGRALATAVQAGADKFRLMEQQISNTNTAAVAYNESMKGFHAQMNVLRQELVATLTALTANSNTLLGPLKEGIQNFLIGLRTTAGQASATTAAVVALGVAFAALAYAHPVTALLAAGLLVVETVIRKIGESTRKSAKEIEDLTKKQAEQSALLQKTSDDLFTILNKVDKHKKDKNGFLLFEDKEANEIQKIINLHPELFKGMDARHLRHEKLVEVIEKQNSLMREQARLEVHNYNLKANEVDTAKQNLNNMKERLGNMSPYERHNSTLPQDVQRETERIKLMDDALATMFATTAGRSNVQSFPTPTGTNRLAMRDETKTPAKKGVPPFNAKEGKDAERAARAEEKAEDVINRILADEAEKAEKLTEEKLKIDRQAAEAQIDNKKLVGRQLINAEIKALDLLDEEFAQRRITRKTKAYQDLAKKLGGNYDAAKNVVTFGPKFKLADVKKAINAVDANLGNQNSADDSAYNKEAEKIDKLGTAPSAKKEHLTSSELEKQANRALMMQQMNLKMRKEMVWTAEELRQIELEDTDAQIRNAEKLQELYADDLTKLGDRSALLGDEAARYDAINEKLTAIIDKEKELQHMRHRQQDGSFEGNFAVGARKGVTALGDFKSNTEQLGEAVTNTIGGGVQNALNGMIDALGKGQNAWKAFRTGVGNMLQEIAQELQKYIVKMMVVYAVQKLIGLATAATTTSPDSLGSAGTSGQMAGGEYSAATGGFVTLAGIQRFAAGGKVLNGIGGGYIPLNLGKRGKDSVPIITMPGEFVVKEDAVNHYGLDFFQRVNAKKFADGGLTGAGSGMSGKGGKNGDTGDFSLNIINVVDVRTIPKTTGQEILNVISYEAAKDGPVFKQWKAKMNGSA